MRRNIELKAVYEDLDAARQTAARAGAERHNVERQIDTYFNVLDGRLKLRQRWVEADGPRVGEPCHSELISYRRSDVGVPRASNYDLLPIPDGAGLRSMLAGALGILVEVDKHRMVYLHDGVRIHLDEVVGLGRFIEIEALVHERCDDDNAHRKLARLMRAFEITEADIIPVSYSDLLMRGETTIRSG